MNNDYTTTTYYVTVDENNYVLTASTAEEDNTLKINMPNASLTDFFAHMNLYKAYKNGNIDFPEFKAATLANQIDQLQSLVNQQSQNLAKAQGIIDQQANVNKQLLAQVGAVTAKLAAQAK